MGFQFGGASGAGYLSVEQREAANAILGKKGTFKGGMYTYVDEHGQTCKTKYPRVTMFLQWSFSCANENN
jgi:hypothetical protein